MTTPPDGPETPSHGHEYPPLEHSGPPTDAYAPVEYPRDATPPQQGYPGQFGPPSPGYNQGGYPPPGYPQGGYPPPGPGAPYPGYQTNYPNPYDPYGSARPTGTNGKAIASLVTSLIGLTCCILPGIVGVILGIMSMREIKQTGQEGHGLALAGVIIGGLAIAFGALGLIFMVFFGVLNDTSSYSSY